MEIKKIVEGMTATEVAQIIDDNFKAAEADKANKNEVNASIDKLTKTVGTNKEETDGKLSELRDEVDDIVYKFQGEIHSNSQDVHNYTSVSNYTLVEVDFKKEQKIRVKLHVNEVSSLSRFVINYNGSSANRIYDTGAGGGASMNDVWIDYVCPVDINLIGFTVINSSVVAEDIVTVYADGMEGGLEENLEETKKKTDKFNVEEVESTNLMNPNEVVVGFLNGANDFRDNLTTYSTSGYIDVEPNMTYNVVTRGNKGHGVRAVAQYDKNNQPIQYDNISEMPSSFTTIDGVKYVRISFLNESHLSGESAENIAVVKSPNTSFDDFGTRVDISIPSNVQYNEKSSTSILTKKDVEDMFVGITGGQMNSPLKGKKWAFCGDSFSAGIGLSSFTEGIYSGKKKIYPYFIAQRNLMGDIVDLSVSGMAMAYVSGKQEAFSQSMYRNVPADVDYITIYLGINDANYNSVIGSIDDTSINTFYGAWNTVMEYLITNHQKAKIGVIITNGSTKAYTDAERAIAKKWGVSFLDMEGIQVPHFLRQSEKVSEQGIPNSVVEAHHNVYALDLANGDTHPNEAAHEFESTFIESWLKSI